MPPAPFAFSLPPLWAKVRWHETAALPGLIAALVLVAILLGLAAVLMKLLGGHEPPPRTREEMRRLDEAAGAGDETGAKAGDEDFR